MKDSMDTPLFPSDYVPWDISKRNPSILLHPNVPMPLHGIAPRVILGPTWWNKERAAAKEKTQNHCVACGVYGRSCKGNLKRLEGHECYTIDWKRCRALYVYTNSICPYCHNYIHSGRLRMLLDEGAITQQHYAAIRKHGDKLIEEAGLVRVDHFVGKNYPEWGKWKLIIFGKSYPGHKSERAYIQFHKKRGIKDE